MVNTCAVLRGIKMKSVILLLVLSSTFAFAVNKDAKVPKLKSGEVAVFVNEKYQIQTFKNYDSLEINSTCFKQNKPQCQAFTKAQVKPVPPKPKDDLIYNPAAINCANMGGKAVVGITDTKSEVDLCLFKDGSTVKSWGAFYKHFPKQVIK